MPSAEKGIATFPVYAFDGRAFSRSDVDIIQEMSLQIFFNERQLATIACTGIHLDELAVGYLKSEGLITSYSDIRDLQMDAEAGVVHILTVAALAQGLADDPCRTGVSPVYELPPPLKGNIASSGARSRLSGGHHDLDRQTIQDALQMSPHQVLQLMDSFIDRCRLHVNTRGTHGAAFTDGKGILVVREDIGRHNALDMLAGYALMNAWNCSDKAVLRTGRVSSEIVFKVWNLGIPVVVSLAAPTARAIELATEAGITLIGAIRGRSMQVYTHERRISL